jgi:hypothetical protein
MVPMRELVSQSLIRQRFFALLVSVVLRGGIDGILSTRTARHTGGPGGGLAKE